MGRGSDITHDNIVAIVTLHKDGRKSSEIARSLGLNVRSVRKWVQRFREGGGKEIPSIKSRSERPKVISPTTS